MHGPHVCEVYCTHPAPVVCVCVCSQGGGESQGGTADGCTQSGGRAVGTAHRRGVPPLTCVCGCVGGCGCGCGCVGVGVGVWVWVCGLVWVYVCVWVWVWVGVHVGRFPPQVYEGHTFLLEQYHKAFLQQQVKSPDVSLSVVAFHDLLRCKYIVVVICCHFQ